jgi:hypothetical protein
MVVFGETKAQACAIAFFRQPTASYAATGFGTDARDPNTRLTGRCYRCLRIVPVVDGTTYCTLSGKGV